MTRLRAWYAKYREDIELMAVLFLVLLLVTTIVTLAIIGIIKLI